MGGYYIVCDGPYRIVTDGPYRPGYAPVVLYGIENERGESQRPPGVRWHERDDGTWTLGPFAAPPDTRPATATRGRSTYCQACRYGDGSDHTYDPDCLALDERVDGEGRPAPLVVPGGHAVPDSSFHDPCHACDNDWVHGHTRRTGCKLEGVPFVSLAERLLTHFVALGNDDSVADVAYLMRHPVEWAHDWPDDERALLRRVMQADGKACAVCAIQLAPKHPEPTGG